MPFLRLNHCKITGKVRHTQSFTKDRLKSWKSRQGQFFHNTLTVNKTSYNLHITKYINWLMITCKHHLYDLIREHLEQQYCSPISNLEVKVSVCQHSITFKFSPRTLIQVVVPILSIKFGIAKIILIQEPSCAQQITVLQLLDNSELQFLSLTLFIFEKSDVCLRFQGDKSWKRTHGTVIFSSFATNQKKIVEFLQRSENEILFGL